MFIETRSLSWSITLHALLVLIAAFGLPIILPKKPDPVPLVMTVELLPISEVSNVKPSDKAITEEKHAQAVKTAKPVEPTVKEPPKPPAPAPEPLPKEVKPKEEPKKDAPKPKEEPKPKEDTNKQKDDFDKLMNQLNQETKPEKSKTAKDDTSTPKNTTKSDAPYDDSLPMSITEKDMIRSQFIPCWTMPAGAKDAHTLAARVKVKLQADGMVIEATIAPDQQGRYNSDMFFRAAADSAIRAAHKCSPIKNLPADKYNSWKEMELNFDPSELM